ncbi:MAG: cell envelope integrity protein TolA [Gammaproteobacteria bacterium]|nr:cell envelope integrity protein TolA [Gammaproteobacteria bacterium]
MSRLARGIRRSRISPVSWLGAVFVHAVIVGLLLQFGAEPARSNIPSRPDVEAVRVQAADEKLLEQKREAHRQALREEELRKQREREAQKKEAKRKREEKRKAEEETRLKAEEKKKKAAARAEAKRKAKEEAKRKRAEKRKREQEARRKAEAERKAKEEARKLKEAEDRAQARREEQSRRRQREAARRARQADIWRIAIKKRIERVWLQPPAVRIAPCEVVVEQDGKGEVLSAKVQGCQASQAWQESLRNAVLKASPLPRPPDPELFDRRLVITFHPKRAR